MENCGQLLKSAMQRELKARDFYQIKARTASSSNAKNFFLKLAEIEQGHYNFLKKKLEEWEASGKVLPIKLIEERLEDSEDDQTSDLSGLRPSFLSAYWMEKNAVEFYQEAARSSQDRETAQFFEEFARWEEFHVIFFKKLIEKYS